MTSGSEWKTMNVKANHSPIAPRRTYILRKWGHGGTTGRATSTSINQI